MRPLPRTGFTLMELLVVIGIILALAGIGFPVMALMKKRAAEQATRSVVQMVAAAVATYPMQRWTVRWDRDGDDADGDGYKDPANAARATPPLEISAPLWDLNQGASVAANGQGLLEGDANEEIDGEPGTSAGDSTDGPFAQALIDGGYRGFALMTGAPIPKRHLNARNQPIDAWKRPLRIVWDASRFGASGFGIWSAGRDGVDGTDDDLTSWAMKGSE